MSDINDSDTRAAVIRKPISRRAHSTSDGLKCCVVDCKVSSVACRGLSFFGIPRKGVSEAKDKWRSAIIAKIDRVDGAFNPDKAKICSRHFDDACIKRGPSGKCSGLVLGSLPTHWLPSKSIVTPKSTSRRDPIPRTTEPPPDRVSYYNFEDIRNDVKKLKHPWIVKIQTSESLEFGIPTDHGWKITVSLKAETDLQADVKILGLPAAQLSTNLEKKKLITFLHELQEMRICDGVKDSSLQDFAEPPNGKCSYYRHFQYQKQAETGHMSHISCVRSHTCKLVIQSDDDLCRDCKYARRLLKEKKDRQTQRLLQPLKANDPLHSLQQSQLKEAYKGVRQVNVHLRKELENFRKKMETESVAVAGELHTGLNAVDEAAIQDLDGLPKLFWEEQQKAFSAKKNGMRWHPMMLRLAILLHTKSKAAYELLRKTGVLKLPGSATLREYTSSERPSEGFQPSVLEELKAQADKLPENCKFVTLLHDEMSIKADLVYDQRSGELIGFCNRDSWSFDENEETLATHALVFYVVGVNSDLKMSLGFFGTRGATADQLMPMLWAAIGCIEMCGLKVMASTSDKASPNQRLSQLHQIPGVEAVCYKTMNLYAPDREVFFLSDVPHLIKTVRNNLASSGSGKNTKLLWKDGKNLLWNHIAGLYHQDMQLGLYKTKLTIDHINLTPHSVMNVRLAAQVLSQTVGRVLQEYGDEESQETAKFILLMDRFFDCLNSRHLQEGDRKRKPDLKAYTDVDDARFEFLEVEFLGYLQDWKNSVAARPGFTQAEQQKMLLSHQTLKGLEMTVRAFVELTRYLLRNGVSFVLSTKFCQDPLEQHFGRHRAIGRTAENPNLYQFGHQENRLRLGRQVSLIVTPRGNVRATCPEPPIPINTSPLKKKPRN